MLTLSSVSKHLTLISRSFLWLAGVGICLVASQVQAAKWQVCLDENPWPPYSYPISEQDNQLTGYTVDIATQVLSYLRLDYEFIRLPWAEVHQRAKNYQKNAQCDMVLDVSLTPERQSYLYFSQPLYQLKYSLVYDNGRVDVANLRQNIKTRQFCGVQGYNYGVLADFLAIRRLDSIQNVLDALNNKQCDFFIIEAAVLQNAIKKQLYQFSNMGCINLEGATKTYRLGIAKKTPQSVAYSAAIDKHINLLRRQGVLSQLTDHYSLEAKSCQGSLSLNSLR